jgi:hypothetical protein
MPVRANSFAPTLLGAVSVSLATVTVTFDSPAWADDLCIEQPPHPIAQGLPGSLPYRYAACHSCHAGATTEVLLWSARYDRAKGRKCWILFDAYGRDVTKAHVRSAAAPTSTPVAPTLISTAPTLISAAPLPTSTEPAPTSYTPPATLSSKIASLFGNLNFMGMSANAAPVGDAPPVSQPRMAPPTPPRKHESDSAAAPPPTSYTPPATLSSKIASLFGNLNFMGMSANAAPVGNALPVSQPQIGPPIPPLSHEGDSANVKKKDSAVQAAQRNVGNGREEKRVSQVTIPQEDRALFEEFLQWREYEKIFKAQK